jgi:hypothetical protein
MPGQIPLTTKYYPSDFNVTTIFLPQHGAQVTSGTTSPGNRAFPVLYFDRDAVVDSISLWMETLGSGTDITFYKLAAPTQASGSSPGSVTGQQAITTTKTLSSSGSAFNVVSGTTSGFSINTSHNVIPAGSMLWFGYTSITWSSQGQAQIQVRWRSQL